MDNVGSTEGVGDRISEAGPDRPVGRVQPSRIPAVVSLAITSNLQLAGAPGNVAVSRRESGLPRKSVVNVSKMATLDKVRLVDRVGRLRRTTMERVDEGLRRVLAL